MKSFQFSVASGGLATRTAWLDLARRAEGEGYHALHVNDHAHQVLSPFPALAAAAAVTTTLRLGPRVANLAVRHPVQLAQDVAALDVLSDGRAELGVGAGWHVEDSRTTGAAFGHGAERRARFTEALDVLDPLLRGETLAWQGSHYQAVVTTALTLRQDRVPLCVGAGGPRMLELAARRADVVSVTGRTRPGGGLDESDLTPERLDDKVSILRAVGGDFDLHHVVWECMITPRPGAVIAAYAAGMGIDEQRLLSMPGLLIGSVEQVVEQVVERRERWGINQVSVPDSCVAQFAPVVARLAGR